MSIECIRTGYREPPSGSEPLLRVVESLFDGFLRVCVERNCAFRAAALSVRKNTAQFEHIFLARNAVRLRRFDKQKRLAEHIFGFILLSVFPCLPCGDVEVGKARGGHVADSTAREIVEERGAVLAGELR